MDLYDRDKLNIVYVDERLGKTNQAVLIMDKGIFKYKPLDYSDLPEDCAVIHKTEYEFFKNPNDVMIELSMPARLHPKFQFLGLRDYHFDDCINIEHIDPSKKIPSKAIKALSDAFLTAQFFNDNFFITNHADEMNKKNLVIPSSTYMSDVYSYDIDNITTDKYLRVLYRDNGRIFGGEYYKDGEMLFSVRASMYGSLCQKAIRTRYILSAYEHLQPNECLGFRHHPSGKDMLLAASVDGGIKIREIPEFKVYPALLTQEARSPYFILRAGLFCGKGPNGTYTALAPKDGDYLSIFIGWAEGEENLFVGPNGVKKFQITDIREMYGR